MDPVADEIIDASAALEGCSKRIFLQSRTMSASASAASARGFMHTQHVLFGLSAGASFDRVGLNLKSN